MELVDRGLRHGFADENSYAATLLSCFVKAYGVEGLEWDAGTIAEQIEKDFDIELPRANFNKLMAGIAVVTTDIFWRDTPRFIELCNALWDGRADETVFDPAEPHEIAWAVAEATLIWPRDEGEKVGYGPAAYTRQALADDGINVPPDVLRLMFETAPDDFDLTDDPEVEMVARDLQNARSTEIDQIVRDRLRELAQQLQSLPLGDDAADASKTLLRSLEDIERRQR